LVELLTRADAEGLEEALAEDVTFSSPVADYHGRADVAHLLRCIAHVLNDLVATSTANDGTRLTMLTATVEGRAIEGILRERHDQDGRLLHATLFLRPYRTLQTAINAMLNLLSANPLPSTRA
jgi:hypothetical protein